MTKLAQDLESKGILSDTNIILNAVFLSFSFATWRARKFTVSSLSTLPTRVNMVLIGNVGIDAHVISAVAGTWISNEATGNYTWVAK